MSLKIQCPDGWSGFSESLSCYRYLIDTVYILLSLNCRFKSDNVDKDTWVNAQQYCHELDSELVVVDDTVERDWISTRIGEFGNYPSFWLGLAYGELDDHGEWRWLNGAKVDESIT